MNSTISSDVLPAPWFNEGLAFECRKCGSCCGGATGTVKVSDEEMVRLADRLSVTLYEFKTRYTRPTDSGMTSLREKDNYDCVFFDRATGCTVYEDRPLQCRTWPFWRSTTRDATAWARTSHACPGVNTGPVVPADRIVDMVACDGTIHA